MTEIGRAGDDSSEQRNDVLTGIADTVAAPQDPLAYSDYHERDDVGNGYGWRPVLVGALALVGAAAAVAAGIVAAWSMRSTFAVPVSVTPPPASTAAPSLSSVAAPPPAADPPAPSTVTVTALVPDTTVETETPAPTAVLTPVALPPSPGDRDSLYLRLLTQGQVTTPEGPATAIAGAHAICRELAAGATPNQITAQILSSNPDGVTSAGAAWDVESATLAYCPR
jgi:hypothetical protein